MRNSLLITALLASTSLASAQTTSTTTFTLSNQSSVFATPVMVNSTVTDTDPAPAVSPTITGITANQSTTNEAPLNPFSGVVIADGNSGATDTLTITLSGGGGTLAGPGLSGTGPYTLTGTPASVTSQLQALVFTPAKPSTGTGTTPPVTVSSNCTASTFTPNSPASCGYVNLLNDNFTSLLDICFNSTSAATCSGANWYGHQYVYSPSYDTPASAVTYNTGGGITLTSTQGTNWQIALATVFGSPYDANGLVCENGACVTPTDNTGGSFSGRVIKGGYFISATYTFNAATIPTNTSLGWPSLWLEPVEKALNAPWGGTVYPGGGNRYIEIDMMEAQLSLGYITKAVHDWGQIEVSNDTTMFEIKIGTNPVTTHTYSELYVAATPTSDGYMQDWIDGVPTVYQAWLYEATPPAQPMPSCVAIVANNSTQGCVPTALFSWADHEHFVFIVGGANGFPVTMSNFQLWQLP